MENNATGKKHAISEKIKMEIAMLSLSEIKPYDRNAKKHNKKQVDVLMKSIVDYGFRQPILIDRDNIIIAGHGRFEAAKQLEMTEVPCLYVGDLTDEQIQQYRLVDNKASELSTWDYDMLKIEMPKIDIEMSDFGFNVKKIFKEKDNNSDDFKQTKGLDNLFKAKMPIVNEWGIPETKPFAESLEGIEWIPYDIINKYKNAENIGVHFYIDDYKFNGVWTNPDKWLEVLKRFKAVITPDFSVYTDMPRAQQLWNHYRRQWLGKYWQDNGVNIVSDVCWHIGDLQDWHIAGIPKGTTIARSWSSSQMKQERLEDFIEIIKSLEPHKIYIKCSKKDEKRLRSFFDFETIDTVSKFYKG